MTDSRFIDAWSNLRLCSVKCSDRGQMTPEWLTALERSYSEGALLFGSDEHDAWIVEITEAAPLLFAMAWEQLRRGEP